MDHLPENDHNLYTCPETPRHMSVSLDKFNYKAYSYYPNYFGGSFAISLVHYKLINGFSNEFWGWGSEDPDIRNRIMDKGLKIIRYPSEIAR